MRNVVPVIADRRGRHEYVHCDTDPPLPFDVVADPLERANLAGDPAHSNLPAHVADEVPGRWDGDAIGTRVPASQRERRVLRGAMSATGQLVSWDRLPPNDADQNVRSHQDWAEAGARLRCPPSERAGA